MTTAHRIRAARLAAGLTQAQAAARCEPRMQRHGWCRLESGAHELTLPTLRRVAAALGTTVVQLLGG